MRDLADRWRHWAPTLNVGRPERWRAALGAGLGILLTELLSHALGAPALIAPMGASAVLLFALPASPLAQPWNMLLGNAVSACVGVACAALLGHAGPGVAPAAAMAAALVAMFALRCLHPPGGAIALTAALQGARPGFVLVPVGLESLVLLAVAEKLTLPAWLSGRLAESGSRVINCGARAMTSVLLATPSFSSVAINSPTT